MPTDTLTLAAAGVPRDLPVANDPTASRFSGSRNLSRPKLGRMIPEHKMEEQPVQHSRLLAILLRSLNVSWEARRDRALPETVDASYLGSLELIPPLAFHIPPSGKSSVYHRPRSFNCGILVHGAKMLVFLGMTCPNSGK